jgi:hypothetical protein
MTVLALTTLASVAEVGSFLYFVAPTKVAKASTLSVTVADAFLPANFTNVHEPLRGV